MSEFRATVEMSGDLAENTARRAAAIGAALDHAAMDPGVRLRMALGEAYSRLMAGEVRGDVVRRLRALVRESGMTGAALAQQDRLAGIVAARSVGGRCGDEISKVQHGLLMEAMISEVSGA